jgi:hypothetical protein
MSPALPKPLPAKALEALARKHGISAKGTRRQVLRRIGRKILPEFDERAYLGSAAAPPTGSFTEDTFTDTDGTNLTSHTGEKGAKWTVSVGTWTIKSGRVVKGNTNYGYAYATGLPAGPNYSVECGVFCVTAVKASRFGGPIGRCSTEADTSYQWGWETGTGYSLLKRVAGVETVLGTFARVGKEGEEDKAILSMVGTAIKGFVGGVERVSATDSAISAAGRAGIRSQGTEGAGPQVNYIIATDVSVAYELSLKDSISLSESLAKAARKTQSDALAVNDQTAKAVAHQQADAVALSDAPAKTTGHVQADTVPLSDSSSRGIAHSQADALLLAEDIGKQPGKRLADGVVISDETAKDAAHRAADSVAVLDAISKAPGRVAADAIGLSDELAKATGHAEADGIQLSDELSKAAEHVEGDAIVLSDSVAKRAERFLFDAVTLADSIIKGAARSIADAIGLSDLIEYVNTRRESHPAVAKVTVRPTASVGIKVSQTTAVSISIRPKVAVAIRVRPAK